MAVTHAFWRSCRSGCVDHYRIRIGIGPGSFKVGILTSDCFGPRHLRFFRAEITGRYGRFEGIKISSDIAERLDIISVDDTRNRVAVV
jgi:hypothetical protein